MPVKGNLIRQYPSLQDDPARAGLPYEEVAKYLRFARIKSKFIGRPLKNVQFCPRSRKAIILTTGIH